MDPEEFTRLLAICLIVGLSLFASGAIAASAGDSSACYSIQDADARSYCLARARRDSGACYTIQRPDLRAQCLSEVRR